MKRSQASGIIIIVIFVIILLIALMLYGGFEVDDFFSKKKTTAGSEALVLSFDNLPTQVNQGQEFDIVVLAKNEGDYKIPKLNVVMNNPQYFGSPNVVYDSRAIEPGEILEIIFESASIAEANIPAGVSVSIDYPYKSNILVEDVCIAPSEKNIICNPIEEKEVLNSAAPVHLTSFTQIAVSSSGSESGNDAVTTRIRLDFEKKGAGEIYVDEELNSFEIEVMKLGNTIISNDNDAHMNLDKTCPKVNEGKVTLSVIDGKTTGYIYCDLIEKVIDTDYTTPLQIELSYDIFQQVKGENIEVMPAL